MSASRALLALTVAFGLLAALGCSGIGGAPGVLVPDDALKIGRDGLTRGQPRSSEGEGDEAGVYIVKLRRGYTDDDILGAGAGGTVGRMAAPAGGGAKAGKGKAGKGKAGKNPGGGGGGGGAEPRNPGAAPRDPVMRNPLADPALGDYLGLGRTVRIVDPAPKEQVIAKYEAMEAVEWIEPAIKMRNQAGPNDPYFAYQWHMQMLNVPTAWQTTMGDGAVVAVIDTGVTAGEDGFHKLLPGYDFVDNDNKPDDLNGHGSHVAGTIAQATNNGIGVAGVAPRASILPVRVLDANGSGSNTWVANGIIWAADHGANIINMSLGSQTSTELIADAVAYAYEKNVTIVAATGNDGSPDHICYPGAYENVISVGSVDLGKAIAFYSNQGKEIDLVAPGGDTSTDSNGDGFPDGVVQETMMDGTRSYFYLQGTSMAAPHVAGAAALVYAKGIRDPDQIARILTSTATDLGAKGWDKTYGNGLVNPVAALGAKAPPARGGGKLQITDSRAKRGQGGTRAQIGWLTTTASTTEVTGSDGFHEVFDARVRQHRVTVRGKRGSTVTYTMRSQAGKQEVSDTIVVKY